MAHSVSEAAARAVKNSERKKVEETRTPEQIIKTLRNNLVSHLAITPSDIAVLLAEYDAANESLIITRADRDRLAHELLSIRVNTP
jgi:hypothetical protein